MQLFSDSYEPLENILYFEILHLFHNDLVDFFFVYKWQKHADDLINEKPDCGKCRWISRKQGKNSATQLVVKTDCSLRKLCLFFFHCICPCMEDSRFTVNNMLPCFQIETANILRSKIGWCFSNIRREADNKVHLNILWFFVFIKNHIVIVVIS